jgi:hypothetical protein
MGKIMAFKRDKMREVFFVGVFEEMFYFWDEFENDVFEDFSNDQSSRNRKCGKNFFFQLKQDFH